MAATLTALVCYCTCPDSGSATHIAEALVEERLAACVNLVPGLHSVYRGQGGIERDDEVLLMIKTTTARMDALQQRILALHPYELPEVIAVEAVGGSPAYLDWIHQQSREET
ncbi:MAG: divalent-cation tolerance protein CutA [Lysobacter sp.]|nr:divalent-cation tolerance protein CutA [Lysobacter sp.]